MGNSRIATDSRIDPRIKAVMGAIDFASASGNAVSRDQLLEEANTEESLAVRELVTAFLGMCDTEDDRAVGRADDHRHVFVSEPDGNKVKLRFIRPRDRRVAVRVLHPRRRDADDVVLRRQVPGVGPHHRRAGRRRGHGRLPQRVSPSSAPEVAPFPAGLNDCVSGVKWVAAHAGGARHRPDRIIVAGESGGGNLTLATGLQALRDGDLGLSRGLYAMCPYIAGQLAAGPRTRRRSRTTASCSTCTTTAARVGVRHRGVRGAATRSCWPWFATEDDVARPRAHDDQRQRVRPAARRGRRTSTGCCCARASPPAAVR